MTKAPSKPRPSPRKKDIEPDADAFIHSRRHTKDDLAEALGEQFLASATSGEEMSEDAMNEEVPEEAGGPFVITSAGSEFADGTDPSNPRDAKRAAVPLVMRTR
jgi:hypothetical protein